MIIYGMSAQSVGIGHSLDESTNRRLAEIARGNVEYAAFARTAIAEAIESVKSTLKELDRRDGDEDIINLASPVVPSSTVERSKVLADMVVPSSTAERSEVLATRYVQRITIKNFRGIADLEITVAEVAPEAGAPWTTFIGENGAGKSSILQAIVLVLAHADGAKATLHPRDVLRRRARRGCVELQLSDEALPLRVSFDRSSESFTYSGPRLSLLVAAYGATRLPSTEKQLATMSLDGIHVANLFDPYFPLINPAKWLLQQSLSDTAFDYAARVVKEILLLNGERRVSRRNGRVLVTLHNVALDIDQLSDGYRSMAALTIDLIAYLQREPERGLESVEGIVLIDEIGANLHPRWKMQVVERLRSALPRIQVFATTHDPLCLRGLLNGEVQVLTRAGSQVYALADLPPVEDLRVDQLLTSEYFGLQSTLDPSLDGQFDEYYALLAKPVRTRNESRRCEALAAELMPREWIGNSRRDRLIVQVIDEYLAKSARIASAQERARLLAAARDRISNVLLGTEDDLE
jgi:hypothetical protein